MQDLTQFLAMGGYAAFVWPAFAVAALVLGGLALQSWLSRRRLTRRLEALPGRRSRAR